MPLEKAGVTKTAPMDHVSADCSDRSIRSHIDGQSDVCHTVEVAHCMRSDEEPPHKM